MNFWWQATGRLVPNLDYEILQDFILQQAMGEFIIPFMGTHKIPDFRASDSFLQSWYESLKEFAG